jgi:hypothetical protein
VTEIENQPAPERGERLTPVPATDVVATRSDRARVSERAAVIVFAAYVAVALPLVLFKLGRYRWFSGDEWDFIASRKAGSLNDLFRPYNDHWSTVPVVVYRLLWQVVGLRSYLPYQACVVGLHLTAAVLLRLIMRRSGVGPWIATIAASSFVLFGPGSQNIVWAFQIGLDGSLVFGLTQLLLADHEGPVDRRDWLGLSAGALALMCSGLGVTMAVVVGLATLLRRGWKVAALHTAPLAVLFGVYALIEHPNTSTVFGRPPVSALLRWLRSGEVGTFLGLGHFSLVAALLAIALVSGLVIAVITEHGRARRRRIADPIAMLIGGIIFFASTAELRWWMGDAAARAGRYLHPGAAFTLPALAVAADSLARRWRVLTPCLLALFLVAIPANSGRSAFIHLPFGPAFHANNRRLLLAAPRMPFARLVPREVRPVPNVSYSRDVTIGFLLDANDAGKLPDPSGPVPQRVVNELKVRLGIAQDYVEPHAQTCREVRGPLDLSPSKGSVYGFLKPLTISTRTGSKPTSVAVVFNSTYGRRLTVELEGLDLRIAPASGNRSFTLCRQS